MNKSEKTKKCKEILYKYPIGQRINLEDSKFLWSIFEGHENWDIKRGYGIKYFTVENPSGYKSRCFFILRKDGTKTDISFHQAITKRNIMTNFRIACRHAVKPIIDEFKSGIVYGFDRCPINSEILTKKNTHIDHFDLTFEEVFQLWIKKQDLQKLSNSLNEGGDLSTEVFFNDFSLVADFRKFHNEHTHLRAVSKISNTSILRKK